MRKSRVVTAVWTLAVLALPVTYVWAGVADTPPPQLISGQISKAIFYIPGVTKNNSMETEFICTNLEQTATIVVGVEVFDSAGGAPLNDVSAGVGDGAQSVPPGGTLTIGTGNTVGFHEDEVIVGLPSNIKSGSARIVSTSKHIACEAFIMDDTMTPPASVASLKMISRKQRGD